MLKFAVPAVGRDPMKPKLNLAEASKMAEAGFRFSIFDPAKDEFNILRPYQQLDPAAIPTKSRPWSADIRSHAKLAAFPKGARRRVSNKKPA